MKCAFCNNDAKSGEHLWDDWINEELPKKTRFNARKRLSLDSAPIEFVSVGLKEKVKVVCQKCNNGWMSALTARMKKRFLKTVLNGAPFSLGRGDAALLSAFTFMKAAVKDYCYGAPPFFMKDARKRLRISLTIPPLARMWIAAFQGSSRYSFQSSFNVVDTSAAPLSGMEFFSYTYIAGNLALQLLAPRWKDVRDWNKPLVTLTPNPYWQPATIQLWPYAGEAHWPPPKYLGDSVISDFINRFSAPIKVPVHF